MVYLIFILLSTFTVMNMLVGVLVEARREDSRVTDEGKAGWQHAPSTNTRAKRRTSQDSAWLPGSTGGSAVTLWSSVGPAILQSTSQVVSMVSSVEKETMEATYVKDHLLGSVPEME